MWPSPPEEDRMKRTEEREAAERISVEEQLLTHNGGAEMRSSGTEFWLEREHATTV